MTIYIPTYGRLGRHDTANSTWKWMVDSGMKEHVVFVVRPDEYTLTRKMHERVMACPNFGIAATRQFILEDSSSDRVLMIDDDQRFIKRVETWHSEYDTRLVKATPGQCAGSVKWLWTAVRKFGMVGLSARGGNNRIKDHPLTRNHRIMRAFAVNRRLVSNVGVRFDDFYYWEDFHICLSLLERGYPNVVNVNYATDGPGLYGIGGITRDVDKMWEEAQRFTDVHPHARIKEKIFKTKTGEIVVPDFTIQWKRAFRSKIC